MRVLKGFVVRDIAGVRAAVAAGGEAAAFSGMVVLSNHAAELIWHLLEEGTEREKIYEKMTETYGIPEATAKQDADRFLAELSAAGVLRDE